MSKGGTKTSCDALFPSGTDAEKTEMILVMGVTGSGKSYYINQLTGRNDAKTGRGLASCTATCQGIKTYIHGRQTLLIDTPGFDDTTRSDTDILAEISRLLVAQYQLGIKLKGVIYLHRITDVRYQASSVKIFRILQDLCGPFAASNVVLVTTRWQDVAEDDGIQREKELREIFWSDMLREGSSMLRFLGDKYSATAITSRLLGKLGVVLQIQRELVDENKSLGQTEAGLFIRGALEQQKLEIQRGLSQRFSDSDEGKLRKVDSDLWSLRNGIADEVKKDIREDVSRKRRFNFTPSPLDLLRLFITITDVVVHVVGMVAHLGPL